MYTVSLKNTPKMKYFVDEKASCQLGRHYLLDVSHVKTRLSEKSFVFFIQFSRDATSSLARPLHVLHSAASRPQTLQLAALT